MVLMNKLAVTNLAPHHTPPLSPEQEYPPDCPQILTLQRETVSLPSIRRGLEDGFAESTALSTPPFFGLPVLTLNVSELLSTGATGVVFKITANSTALVIKAIPPRWTGAGDLLNEASIYQVLASLQGSALPRMAGCFQGEGWTILIMEHCGSAVGDDMSSFSLHQR
jgi:hypothetical protein